MELTVLAEKFSIDEMEAKRIIGNTLPVIKEERSEYEKQYLDIVKMDIENPETWKLAKELRLKIVKNRTQGFGAWHKTNKEMFLRGGQFVDAIHRTEILLNQKMEEDLREIELHEEKLERKRIDELRNLRINELSELGLVAPDGVDLGSIDDNFYDLFKSGLIAKKKQQEEMEALMLDQERISKVKERLLPYSAYIGEVDYSKVTESEVIGLIKKAQQEIDNAKKEQAELKAKLEAERLEKERIENESKAKLEAEKKAAEERLAKAKEEAEKKAKAEREAFEKKLAKARELARIEREKQEYIAKEEAGKQAERIAEANKSLEGYKKSILDTLDAIKLPEPNDDTKKELKSNVEALIDKIRVYVQKYEVK